MLETSKQGSDHRHAPCCTDEEEALTVGQRIIVMGTVRTDARAVEPDVSLRYAPAGGGAMRLAVRRSWFGLLLAVALSTIAGAADAGLLPSRDEARLLLERVALEHGVALGAFSRVRLGRVSLGEVTLAGTVSAPRPTVNGGKVTLDGRPLTQPRPESTVQPRVSELLRGVAARLERSRR
jgi:hypothetical protein